MTTTETITIQTTIRWIDGQLTATLGGASVVLGVAEERDKYDGKGVEYIAEIPDWGRSFGDEWLMATVRCTDLDEARAVVLALLGVRGLNVKGSTTIAEAEGCTASCRLRSCSAGGSHTRSWRRLGSRIGRLRKTPTWGSMAVSTVKGRDEGGVALAIEAITEEAIAEVQS